MIDEEPSDVDEGLTESDELLRPFVRAPSRAPRDDGRAEPGARVGRFEVVRALGEGGMGIVYEAQDERLARRVALKMLGRYASDPDRRARFKREARSAARVAHPNVATVFESGEDGAGNVFLAMELVEGETVRARLRADGAFTRDEALRVARAVASGLEAAHEAGVIHRDLKPENVMLTRDGGVKVLDFGLAKLAPNVSSTESDARTVGVLLGTPGYMPPEQLAGGDVDARADVFALGILLFEMTTGPSTTDEPLNLALLRHDGPLHALEQRDPTLGALVARCVASDRRERFASAREVIDAIDREASGRAAKRALAPASIALVGIAVLAVATFAATLRSSRASPKASHERAAEEPATTSTAQAQTAPPPNTIAAVAAPPARSATEPATSASARAADARRPPGKSAHPQATKSPDPMSDQF